MRSPRAVNRTHTRCTPIHAHHSKGQRLSSLRALHKAIRHSLVNQDAYAEKASLIFGQLDLKLAEFMKKAELSEEERLEKERRAALKKIERDAQVKAKKEAEQRRKQEKLERKQAEAATKQTIDPKLEAATYIPQTVVVEESKPLKKEETKKNKKNEKKPVEKSFEAKEEPIVKLEAPSPVESEEKVDKKSKKDKKEKKKSESEKLIDEVKLFEATATPKNTPIDTPKEAPATPAEYDLEPQPQHQIDLSKAVDEKKSKKNKKEKEKKEIESKAEIKEINNEVKVEEPIIEKVEQVKQEVTPEVHEDKKSKKDKKNKKTSESEAKVEGIPETVEKVEKVEEPVEHKEPSKKDKKKNKKNSESEPKVEAIEAKTEVIEAPKTERLEEPVSIQIDEKESKKDKKKNKKEKKTSESQSQFSPDSGVVIEQISAPQSNIENTDIWEEFASPKPIFKEFDEEKPQTSDEISNFPIGHWETPTLELSATEIWGEGGKKKKHKEEPIVVPRPSYNTWDEPIKHEKELEKAINVPAPEAPKDVWEEFTSGKPIFKEENKAGNLVKQVSIEEAIRVPEPDAPIDIWEEFTSGKPLFKNDDDISEDLVKEAEAAIEASRRIWADQQATGSGDIWEEFTSGKPLFKDESTATQKHIDVESQAEKVTATVTKTEPEAPKQEKESKSKKKDKKHKKSESENNVEAEPVKNGHPIVEEKKEEPVELKSDAPANQTPDIKSNDKKDNKKKNKKGKTNSESEQVIEKKSSPVKEVQEKPVPEPTKVEPVSTPSPTNNGSKNKKKNKGKHGKDNNSPVAEEKQSPVPSGKFDPVEEASHQHVEDLKSAQTDVKINGVNGNAVNDHGFEEQKGKKSRKKNKSRSSESNELNGKFENAQVITELNYNNDDVNKMGIESTSEQVEASPVQVNEVTSSEATEGNQRVYRENIKAAYDIDSSADPTAHPTQFAIQVQKLVESTLAASELKHADPNTKYSVQAQLLRLKEHDDQPKQTYTLRPLTPLAFERHVTVEEGKRSPYTPSPRERSYKLLPKDVLFCSYMIDAYGEDYEGMTKDAKNVYRENARSLQRKMRVFKESPHFDTYKKHKETGRSVEEILQEEAAAQA